MADNHKLRSRFDPKQPKRDLENYMFYAAYFFTSSTASAQI
jgi:hypothetical protein